MTSPLSNIEFTRHYYSLLVGYWDGLGLRLVSPGNFRTDLLDQRMAYDQVPNS